MGFLESEQSIATPLPATVEDFEKNWKVIEKPQMSAINPGVWDGMTPDQVRKYYPAEWERFVNDPYAYRAPRARAKKPGATAAPSAGPRVD